MHSVPRQVPGKQISIRDVSRIYLVLKRLHLGRVDDLLGRQPHRPVQVWHGVGLELTVLALLLKDPVDLLLFSLLDLLRKSDKGETPR